MKRRRNMKIMRDPDTKRESKFEHQIKIMFNHGNYNIIPGLPKRKEGKGSRDWSKF
jgi:hypothetical protein